MRILLSGDWHIRETSPINRRDDFKQALLKKLSYIFQIARKERAAYILQPGDFFDAAGKVSYSMLAHWGKFFAITNRGHKVLTVLGQHDLQNHNLTDGNIPSRVLEAIEGVHLLTDDPCILPSESSKQIHIYGASWNAEIPQIKDPSALNILVIHKMFVKDNPLWKEQIDYTISREFLKQHAFNLVVSGDNHQKFTHMLNDEKILVNAGALMRTAKDQKDHKPAIFIYDTNSNKIKEIRIPIKPFEEVFDIEKIQYREQMESELDELINIFESEYTPSLDFANNLAHLREMASADVNNFFEEALNE